MPKLVWLNGTVTPLEQAVVSVADHAHLYGDGLFEGIRIYHHKVFRLDAHLKRLYEGAKFLGFDMNVAIDELKAIVLDVCRQADISDGYIRLNLTRGTGLGLDPKKIDTRPNLMVMISELNLYPKEMFEKGVSCNLSPIRVIPADSLDPQLKCIGRYASNIYAKMLANRQGVGDALMLNHQGFVAEGTGNNIFIVKDNVLHTPHPSCGILKGITRGVAMDLAREAGYQVVEDFLTLQDVYAADEAFFTGTATEIMPFTMLDGTPIGTGKPGAITKCVMAAFEQAVHEGTPF